MKLDYGLRLEESRPGYFFIGGRKYGRACRLAWESVEGHRSPSACAIACAVGAICSLLVHLHTARRPFDQRLSSNVPRWARLFDAHLNRASNLP